MTRARCRGSFCTPFCRLFFVEHGNDKRLSHVCGTFPSRQIRVVSRWSSRRMVRSCWKSEFRQFHGKAIRPHWLRVCHCLDRCGNLLRGLDPEGTRDGLLRGNLLECRDEACRIPRSAARRADESHSSSWMRRLSRSSLPSSSRRYCGSNVVHLLQLHGIDVLEKSMLVSHPQLLIQPQRHGARRNERLLHLALSKA